MLEHIKQLEQAGDWAELHRLAETLPHGDTLARVHLALTLYHEQGATNGKEYRKALQHARLATATADAGSLLYVWSFSKSAAYAADLGDYRGAEQDAHAFLRLKSSQPDAERNIAVVYFALARAAHYGRRYGEAVTYWRLASETAPFEELRERARLHLVWTLAESGNVAGAVDALPQAVAHVAEGHLCGARAVVSAALGDWEGARTHALAALRSWFAGEWKVFDVVEIAELLLVLKSAALHMGAYKQAATWYIYSAANLAGWNEALMPLLVPTLPPEGGEHPHAASSSCGPSGYRRTGLLGTVG